MFKEVNYSESNARKVLIFCFLGWFINFADRSILSPVIPMIQEELALSNTMIGFLASAFFIGYTISPIPGGMLSDRFGFKKVIVPSIFGFGLTTALTAFARGGIFLAVMRAFTGVFEGSFYSSAVGYVSQVYKKASRGTAMAIFSMGWTLGTCAGILFAAYVAKAMGWRAPWAFMIIPTFIIGFLALKWMPAIAKKSTPLHKESQDANVSTKGTFRQIIKIRNAWIIFALQFIANFGLWSINTWTPKYFIENKGYAFIAASILFAVLYLPGTLGSFVSGKISDRIGRRTAITVFYVLAGLCWYLVLASENITQTTAAVIIAGFFIAGLYPTILVWMSDSVPAHLVGAAAGFGIMGAELGAFTTPIISGYIADKVGLSAALNIYIWTYILGGFIVWFGKDMKGGAVEKKGAAT